jgi:hypothetical protein
VPTSRRTPATWNAGTKTTPGADASIPELFADEEERLTNDIRALRDEDERARDETARQAEITRRFDEVLGILRELNIDEIWAEATGQERRVLVEELLDVLAIFPDHPEVTGKGAPRLNVTLDEVGLKGGWWQLFVSEGRLGPYPHR